MTVFTLIGEEIPTVREADLLTEDHPARDYPPKQPFRNSAWLRAGVFVGVMVVTVLLLISAWVAVTMTVSSVSGVARSLIELISAVVAYIVLVFVMEARTRPTELEPGRLLGLIKGIGLGAACVAICIGVLALLGAYRVGEVDPGYFTSPAFATTLLTTVAAAGLAEEIILRGVVFRLVEEGLGSWGGVAVSALIFGGLHLPNPDATVWGAVAIAIEGGILFSAVYVITRSLWWCVGLHAAWNLVEGPIFGSIVSGTGTRSSWLQAQWSGPDILTGGQFGLEGSIVPVILLGGLGLFLLVYAQRRHIMVAPIWARKAALQPSR
ncbi:MAG: CPBP family intramembrane metalloprotease [Propionibacteriaceae bacterium]|nr:CPBP family intramembrane metalloprotease [Propionibacteriaceae bacterium]